MKPTLLFRGPIKTRSGYGSHSRDLLESLYHMDMFDIKIDSCGWGTTPLTAFQQDNEFHQWIEQNIVTTFNGLPDFYVQVTVPNEFRRYGKFNIGVTAGIETTLAPKDWIDGCNIMDLIITTSTFSKEALLSTVYNEEHKETKQIIKQHKIEKPVEVLFEGADTSIYNDRINDDFKLDIKENFAYLFVGHWLSGELGQDRKDVGMLIKCFCEAFNDKKDQPALVLKTSSASFSVIERERIKKMILELTKDYTNPPSIYLLFGDLTDKEMNDLYNHPKIKSMVSITKGEGFGRPLLEFTMTGKPVIASNWSGQKDFLTLEKSVLIGGKLTEVHDSAVNSFIIKGSKWFTANYNEVIEILQILKKDYNNFLTRSQSLKEDNKVNFSLEKMTEKFKSIISPFVVITPKPQPTTLILPKLNKVL
jgi:glycosyltransferase involved in cell wall biosynthesis